MNDFEQLLLQKKLPKGYRGLVLCGGGTKTFAFAGAIRYLQQHKLLRKLKYVLGVSAGAIVGLGIVLGYTHKQIDEFITRLSADRVFDVNISGGMFAIPKVAYRLYQSSGINSGKKLKDFLRSVVVGKNVPYSVSFEELYDITHKHFQVSAVCVETRQLVYFSHTTTPKVKVIDAVRASSCIPYVFEPVKVGNHHYIDGGLINNFPISEIKTKKPILGLKIEVENNHSVNDNQSQSQSRGVSLFGLSNCVLDVLFQNTWPNLREVPDNVNVCTIRTPNISFIDLDISTATSQRLRNCGYDCVRQRLVGEIGLH